MAADDWDLMLEQFAALVNEPRLTEGRRFAKKERTGQLEGIPPAARGRLGQQAYRNTFESLVQMAPFTPALIADAVSSPDSARSNVPALAAIAVAPGAGKVKAAKGIFQALASNAKGLKTQAALAAGVPAAAGWAADAAAAAPPRSAANAPGGDGVRQSLERDVSLKLQAYEQALAFEKAEFEGTGGSKKKGAGPKLKELQEKTSSAERALKEAQNRLRTYRSDDEVNAEAGWRVGALLGGVGLGTAAGVLANRRGRAKATKSVADFADVAKRARLLDSLTKDRPIAGTREGEALGALVNEGYRAGGAKAPFESTGGALKERMFLDPGRYSKRPVPSDTLFDGLGGLRGDTALPAALTAEGAGSILYGSGALKPYGMDPGPERGEMLQNIGYASLMAGLGYKGARYAGKMALPGAPAADKAAVNAARSRLAREIEESRPQNMLWQRALQSAGLTPEAAMMSRATAATDQANRSYAAGLRSGERVLSAEEAAELKAFERAARVARADTDLQAERLQSAARLRDLRQQLRASGRTPGQGQPMPPNTPQGPQPPPGGPRQPPAPPAPPPAGPTRQSTTTTGGGQAPAPQPPNPPVRRDRASPYSGKTRVRAQEIWDDTLDAVKPADRSGYTPDGEAIAQRIARALTAQGRNVPGRVIDDRTAASIQAFDLIRRSGADPWNPFLRELMKGGDKLGIIGALAAVEAARRASEYGGPR